MVGTGAAAPSPPSGPPAGAWLLARTHRKHRRAQPPNRTSAPSRVTCRVDWIGPAPPPGTRAGPHTTDESETWLQAPGAKAGVRRTWVSASPPLAHGRRRRPRRYPARAARPGRGRGPGWGGRGRCRARRAPCPGCVLCRGLCRGLCPRPCPGRHHRPPSPCPARHCPRSSASWFGHSLTPAANVGRTVPGRARNSDGRSGTRGGSPRRMCSRWISRVRRYSSSGRRGWACTTGAPGT